jgi:hypothetical protein
MQQRFRILAAMPLPGKWRDLMWIDFSLALLSAPQ